MKASYQVSNKYESAIAEGSSIDNSSESGTFTVAASTVSGYSLPGNGKKYFLIIDNGTANEEIFRISGRVGNVLSFDKRLAYPNGKKSHAAGAVVQLNDLAELLNEVAKHVDDCGYVEEVVGASPKAVKVRGGSIAYNSFGLLEPSNISDATFAVGTTSATTLTDNVLNYIVFDFVSGTFKVVQSADLVNVRGSLLATVSVSGGSIIGVTDYRKNYLGMDYSSLGTLPPQLGEDGKWLQTNGITATWNNITFPYPPAGNPQSIPDSKVPPSGFEITDDGATFVKVKNNVSNFYTLYSLTAITEYDNADNILSIQEKTSGTFGVDGITYADGSTINKVTGVYTFTGSPAYINSNNTFLASNVFEGDVVFKKRIAFPFHDNGSSAGAVTFDAMNGLNQKVELTGASAHTVTFDNLVAGVYVFFCSQQAGGSGAVTFAIGTGNGDVTSVAVMNASFVNGAVAATPGTHIFTILVAETKAHVTYNGTSV